MIAPDAVQAAAKRKEKENMRFRTFLKNCANPDKLDQQFAELHKELFSQYDCSQCRNCCRAYSVALEEEEVEAIASFFQQSTEEFAREFLVQEGDEYTLAAPCRFLSEDGICLVEPCKPKTCRDFPYTDKPERIASLYGVLEFAEVCPVVYELLERLKEILSIQTLSAAIQAVYVRSDGNTFIIIMILLLIALREEGGMGMNVNRSFEDMAIAKAALERSLLTTTVKNRPLLCEVYCIPAQNHQAFFLQIYGGEKYILLYAKPSIVRYDGGRNVILPFCAAIEADKHPGFKGDIYCGMKYLPKDDQTINTLLQCLPCREEERPGQGVYIDGTLTVVRNCNSDPPVTLAYYDAQQITVNALTPEQRIFLDDLYLHIEIIIGNLISSEQRKI